MSINLKFKKKCLVLHTQTTEIVDQVTKFYACEAKEGITIPLNKVKEFVLEAIGIFKNTAYKI